MELMSHGPREDIVDMYTTLPWELLCSELLNIKIELREGVVIPMLKAVGGKTDDVDPDDASADLVHSWYRHDASETQSV